jgi:hypothetical protein
MGAIDTSKASSESLECVWDHYVDIASFAAIGYLSGRAVNWFIKWTSPSSIITTKEQVDLIGAVACCALFVAIDSIAYSILSSFESYDFNKTICSVLRVGASVIAAVSMFNVLAWPLNLASIEMKPGFAIIFTAIIIYSQFLMHLTLFNGRYEKYVSDEDY